MKLALAPTLWLAAFLVAPGPTFFVTLFAMVMGFALLLGALMSRELSR